MISFHVMRLIFWVGMPALFVSIAVVALCCLLPRRHVYYRAWRGEVHYVSSVLEPPPLGEWTTVTPTPIFCFSAMKMAARLERRHRGILKRDADMPRAAIVTPDEQGVTMLQPIKKGWPPPPLLDDE